MTLTKIASTGVEDSLRWVLGANGSSDYTFTGPGLTGTVNDPTIYLTRGHTYIFQNNSGGHPFYIKTSIANGGTNDAYNTGVTNNGGGNGTEIVFTVPHDSPDILYYQCSSHASMAGQFNIAGSVADSSITTAKLADDAVTSAKIATSGVESGNIQALAISTAKIQDNAITTTKIADSQITTAKINDAAVTTAKINDGAVTTAKIGTEQVVASNIAGGNITAGKLGSNSVTTAKIADQAVTLAKLPHGTSSNDGKFLRANNGADPSFESVPSPAITAIASASNNRVITSNGGTTVNAEPNLTFDGSKLAISNTSSTDANNTVNGVGFTSGTFHHRSRGNSAGISGQTYSNQLISSNGTNVALELYTIGGTGTPIVFGTDSTERMRIDNAGRVGIGTGSSITNYDLGARTLILNESGSYAGMTVRSSNQGSIYFADGTTGNQSYRGRIEYDHVNDRMYMGTSSSTAGIHIHSNNIVTKPSHPAFMARLGQNAVINNGYREFSNSDGLVVNSNQGHYLTTVDYNQGNHYNSNTTRFTAPVDGLYYFEVVISTSSAGPATAYLSTEVYVNGGRKYSGWQQKDSGYQKVQQCFYLELSANDYVEPGYESQQSVNVIGSSNTGKYYTYFTGYLIG